MMYFIVFSFRRKGVQGGRGQGSLVDSFLYAYSGVLPKKKKKKKKETLMHNNILPLCCKQVVVQREHHQGTKEQSERA